MHARSGMPIKFKDGLKSRKKVKREEEKKLRHPTGNVTNQGKRGL